MPSLADGSNVAQSIACLGNQQTGSRSGSPAARSRQGPATKCSLHIPVVTASCARRLPLRWIASQQEAPLLLKHTHTRNHPPPVPRIFWGQLTPHLSLGTRAYTGVMSSAAVAGIALAVVGFGGRLLCGVTCPCGVDMPYPATHIIPPPPQPIHRHGKPFHASPIPRRPCHSLSLQFGLAERCQLYSVFTHLTHLSRLSRPCFFDPAWFTLPQSVPSDPVRLICLSHPDSVSLTLTPVPNSFQLLQDELPCVLLSTCRRTRLTYPSLIFQLHRCVQCLAHALPTAGSSNQRPRNIMLQYISAQRDTLQPFGIPFAHRGPGAACCYEHTLR